MSDKPGVIEGGGKGHTSEATEQPVLTPDRPQEHVDSAPITSLADLALAGEAHEAEPHDLAKPTSLKEVAEAHDAEAEPTETAAPTASPDLLPPREGPLPKDVLQHKLQLANENALPHDDYQKLIEKLLQEEDLDLSTREGRQLASHIFNYQATIDPDNKTLLGAALYVNNPEQVANLLDNIADLTDAQRDMLKEDAQHYASIISEDFVYWLVFSKDADGKIRQPIMFPAGRPKPATVTADHDAVTAVKEAHPEPEPERQLQTQTEPRRQEPPKGPPKPPDETDVRPDDDITPLAIATPETETDPRRDPPKPPDGGGNNPPHDPTDLDPAGLQADRTRPPEDPPRQSEPEGPIVRTGTIVNRQEDIEKRARELAEKQLRTAYQKHAWWNILDIPRKIVLKFTEEHYLRRGVKDAKAAMVANNNAYLDINVIGRGASKVRGTKVQFAGEHANRTEEQLAAKTKIAQLHLTREAGMGNELRIVTGRAHQMLCTEVLDRIMYDPNFPRDPSNPIRTDMAVQYLLRTFIKNHENDRDADVKRQIQEVFGKNANISKQVSEYFASDMLELANTVKTDIDQGKYTREQIAEHVQFNFANTNWAADTKIKLSLGDRIVARMERGIGFKGARLGVNEATASLTAVGLATGFKLTSRVAIKALTFGGAAGGVFAALSRGKNLGRDIRTSRADTEYGDLGLNRPARVGILRKIFDTQQKLRRYEYQTASVNDMLLSDTRPLELTLGDNRSLKTLMDSDISGTSPEGNANRDALIKRAAEIRERMLFSKFRQKGLISDLGRFTTEQNRWTLTQSVIDAKNYLRQSGMSEQEIETRMHQHQADWRAQFSGDVNRQDKRMNWYRARSMATFALFGGAAATATLLGSQEAIARTTELLGNKPVVNQTIAERLLRINKPNPAAASEVQAAVANAKPGEKITLGDLEGHRDASGQIIIDSLKGQPINADTPIALSYDQEQEKFFVPGTLSPDIAAALNNLGLKLAEGQFVSEAMNNSAGAITELVPGTEFKIDIPQGTTLQPAASGNGFELVTTDTPPIMLVNEITFNAAGELDNVHILREDLIATGDPRAGEAITFNTDTFLEQHSGNEINIHQFQWYDEVRPRVSDQNELMLQDRRVGDQAVQWDIRGMGESTNTNGSLPAVNVQQLIQDNQAVMAFWNHDNPEEPMFVRMSEGTLTLDQNGSGTVEMYINGEWQDVPESTLAQVVFANDLGNFEEASNATGYMDKFNMNSSAGMLVEQDGHMEFRSFATDIGHGTPPEVITQTSQIPTIESVQQPVTVVEFPSAEEQGWDAPAIPLVYTPRRPLKDAKNRQETVRREPKITRQQKEAFQRYMNTRQLPLPLQAPLPAFIQTPEPGKSLPDDGRRIMAYQPIPDPEDPSKIAGYLPIHGIPEQVAYILGHPPTQDETELINAGLTVPDVAVLNAELLRTNAILTPEQRDLLEQRADAQRGTFNINEFLAELRGEIPPSAERADLPYVAPAAMTYGAFSQLIRLPKELGREVTFKGRSVQGIDISDRRGDGRIYVVFADGTNRGLSRTRRAPNGDISQLTEVSLDPQRGFVATITDLAGEVIDDKPALYEFLSKWEVPKKKELQKQLFTAQQRALVREIEKQAEAAARANWTNANPITDPQTVFDSEFIISPYGGVFPVISRENGITVVLPNGNKYLIPEAELQEWGLFTNPNTYQPSGLIDVLQKQLQLPPEAKEKLIETLTSFVQEAAEQHSYSKRSAAQAFFQIFSLTLSDDITKEQAIDALTEVEDEDETFTPEEKEFITAYYDRMKAILKQIEPVADTTEGTPADETTTPKEQADDKPTDETTATTEVASTIDQPEKETHETAWSNPNPAPSFAALKANNYIVSPEGELYEILATGKNSASVQSLQDDTTLMIEPDELHQWGMLEDSNTHEPAGLYAYIREQQPELGEKTETVISAMEEFLNKSDNEYHFDEGSSRDTALEAFKWAEDTQASEEDLENFFTRAATKMASEKTAESTEFIKTYYNELKAILETESPQPERTDKATADDITIPVTAGAAAATIPLTTNADETDTGNASDAEALAESNEETTTDTLREGPETDIHTPGGE